jgi:alpha-galactosidase
VPEDDVAFRTAGFNHQCFVLEFRRRSTGEDLYPRLREIVDADPEGLGRRVRVEIFRRFGYFPTESSEHSSEYVPWFLHHDGEVERFRCEIDEYIRRSDENLEDWARTKALLDAGEELEIEPTSELASEIIHSIETGTVREVYTNVRNGGLIDGLPEDACVEVPTLVDKNGVQPTRIGVLPPQCLALNRTFVNVVQLTVYAALEERRDLVYQAALLDPNTAATLTTSQIVSMVDDLIDAHGDLIPEGIRRAG